MKSLNLSYENYTVYSWVGLCWSIIVSQNLKKIN